jgi:hypothetical protein
MFGTIGFKEVKSITTRKSTTVSVQRLPGHRKPLMHAIPVMAVLLSLAMMLAFAMKWTMTQKRLFFVTVLFAR